MIRLNDVQVQEFEAWKDGLRQLYQVYIEGIKAGNQEEVSEEVQLITGVKQNIEKMYIGTNYVYYNQEIVRTERQFGLIIARYCQAVFACTRSEFVNELQIQYEIELFRIFGLK